METMDNEDPLKEQALPARPLESLRTALAFLTQLPMGPSVRFDIDSVRQSVLFYPLVGLLLGAMAFMAAILLPASSFLAAALISLLLVFITGGLHLDGLADCTDAWFGGLGDKARTLEIMKDSHSGAMAVVSVSMLLIVKTAAVYEAIELESFKLLVLAPFLSRLSILGLVVSTDYVGEGVIGKALTQAEPNHLYGVIVCSTLLCFLLFPQEELIVLLALVFAGAVFLRKMMLNRLQGFTGDCAGAQIELIELLALVGGCLVLN